MSTEPGQAHFSYVRSNPMMFIDPDGRESAGIHLDNDAQDLLNGKISVAEYQQRIQARGTGALMAVSLLVPGVEDVAFAAVSKLGVGARIGNVFRRLFGKVPKSSKGNDPLAIAGKAAQGFENLECVECASAVAKALRERGIKGRLIKVKARGGRDFIAADRFKNGRESITQNGTHQAVQVGDTVFDNLSPDGIPADDFFKDLHAISGVEFDISDF